MYARVTTVQGRPDQIDDAVRLIENDVIPAAELMSGFKGGHWLADREHGKMIAVTYWETEDDMVASDDRVRQLREQTVDKIGAHVEGVEHYEVVARA